VDIYNLLSFKQVAGSPVISGTLFAVWPLQNETIRYSDDTYKGALMANIWVVDDDLFYRKLISEELKAYGHDVTTLHNGMNLSLVLEEEHPDLLILDVFMAQKNGIDLLEDLNRKTENRGELRVPVIVITGDDSEETELAARKARADYFMLKPFSKKKISEVVNHLLKGGECAKSLKAHDPRKF